MLKKGLMWCCHSAQVGDFNQSANAAHLWYLSTAGMVRSFRILHVPTWHAVSNSYKSSFYYSRSFCDRSLLISEWSLETCLVLDQTLFSTFDSSGQYSYFTSTILLWNLEKCRNICPQKMELGRSLGDHIRVASKHLYCLPFSEMAGYKDF